MSPVRKGGGESAAFLLPTHLALFITGWTTSATAASALNVLFRGAGPLIANIQQIRLWLVILTTATFASGCGGSAAGAKKMAGAVSGAVTFQGQPVPAGTVQLYSPSTGATGIAPLDAAGKFKLTTPIPVGEYHVIVAPPPEPPPQVGVPYAPKTYKNIPTKYRTDATTTLKADLKAEANVLALEMTP